MQAAVLSGRGCFSQGLHAAADASTAVIFMDAVIDMIARR